MEIAVSQIDQLRNFISEITFTEVEKIKGGIYKEILKQV